MRNVFKVEKVEIEKNRIYCTYVVEGEWEHFFTNIPFELEYSFSLQGLPKAIAVIPLLCNIIPLAWICDAEIIADEVDETFIECLEDVREGYKKMYPMLSFKGIVQAKKVLCDNVNNKEEKSATFFSGGADAFHTLFRHIDEKPELLTVWGADVKLEDTSGWKNVCKHIDNTSQLFNLTNIKIKSNFRSIVKEAEVDKLVASSNDGWWHGFQSGMGLLGHGAPCAYIKGLQNIYIASSYSEAAKGQYTCASDPTIDNYLKYANCRIIHDAYEYSRQDKIRDICEYSNRVKKDLNLRVCWQSSGGKNCCKCEKCYRTILEIESEGYNANNFGFIWDEEKKKQCKKDMLRKITISKMNIDALWKPIQNKMLENPEKFSEYDWLMKMNWKKFNTSWRKKVRKSIVYRGIKKMYRLISRM